MARKRGFFRSLGTFFRVAIWGLAGVMAFALWLAWSDKTPPPGDTTIAALPDDPRGTDTGDSVAVEEVANEPALDETTETDAGAVEPVPADSAPVTDSAEAVETPPVEDAGSQEQPEAMATLTVLTDPDATYVLHDLTPRDDGIEITTARTEAEVTVYTTRLVTCAPLAVGTIGEGPDLDTMARTESPELERIVLGTTESLIAAAACARR